MQRFREEVSLLSALNFSDFLANFNKICDPTKPVAPVTRTSFTFSGQGILINSEYTSGILLRSYKNDDINKIVKADKNVRPWHLLDSIGKKDCRASIEYFESLQSGGYTIVLLLINLYNFFNTILLYHSNPKSNIYGLNKIVSSNLPMYVQNYKKNEIS